MLIPLRVRGAVGLVAGLLIILQISFTRLIGYKLFYHFVFLAIAISLLGLGAAATYVALKPAPKERVDERVATWLAALVLLIPLCLLAMANPFPLNDDGHRIIKLIQRDAIQYLTWTSFFMLLVNFVGGLILAQLFRTYSERMGALYAVDLIGAGLGCLGAVALMKYGSPPFAFLSSTALALVACLLYAKPTRYHRARNALLGMFLGGLALFCFALLGPERFTNFQNFRRKTADTEIIKYEWNHIIRTDHIKGNYVLDGDASTPIVKWDDRAQPVTEPALSMAKPHPKVAIIGAGGGPQVLEARRKGARHILAIDINPAIGKWVLEDDRALNNDLFVSESIKVAVGEGRHVIRSSGARFDVILMHSIDTWAASAAGAYALTENFLYTKEAISDYLDVMTDDGLMSIRRWLFNPPRENMRLFVTVLEALRARGAARPEDHVAIIAPVADYKDWSNNRRLWGYLLFSKRPFSPETIDRLERHAQSQGWSLLFAPHREAQTVFHGYVQAKDRAAFQASYPYLISEVTDANPYLFQYYNPLHKTTYQTHSDWAVAAISQSSSIVLPVSLAASIVLSLVLIILPLLVTRRKREATWRLSLRDMLYFTCLGVGFMAVEVPLTQILALYLGHPTYAFSIVLVALLISTGTGSLLIERVMISQRMICGLIAGLLTVVALSIFPVIHATIHWPDPMRFGLAIIAVALCGLPMGFPLALAVRAIGRVRPDDVPWAWAINSAASVVGSCLIMILMVFTSSYTALGLGACCYAVAMLTSARAR